ncbi:hypothetical protein GGR52DRAFT_512090 [Hypoxylon sp. FL1284]|nr:hypothetical protein GGR52DRAFT_512090 [Hypoxylon sp. FL1284]
MDICYWTEALPHSRIAGFALILGPNCGVQFFILPRLPGLIPFFPSLFLYIPILFFHLICYLNCYSGYIDIPPRVGSSLRLSSLSYLLCYSLLWHVNRQSRRIICTHYVLSSFPPGPPALHQHRLANRTN